MKANSYDCDYQSWRHALRAGYLEILELVEDEVPTTYCFSRAVKYGHVHMTDWLTSIGCYTDDRSCSYAAKYRQFDMLKYLYVRGFRLSEQTSAMAAGAGDIEILQWLLDKNCPMTYRVCSEATKNGRFHVLKWAKNHGLNYDKRTTRAAATTGRLNMFVWLMKKKCPYGLKSAFSAAYYGHLHVLEWLYQQGQILTDTTFLYAVRDKQEHVLRWIIRQSCPPHTMAFDWAIMGQNANILALLTETGYYVHMYENICLLAAKHYYYISLKWLCENGFPCAENVCSEIIKSHFRGANQPWRNEVEINIIDILTYLADKNYLRDVHACEEAIIIGNLTIVRLLREKGFPWPKNGSDLAKHHGWEDIVEWIQEHED